MPVVFRALLPHIVELQGNTSILEIGTSKRINLPLAFFPNETICLRSQGHKVSTQQTSKQSSRQIYRFQAKLSNFPKPYSPATVSTSNKTSFFGFPTFKIGGDVCTTQNGITHRASDPHF